MVYWGPVGVPVVSVVNVTRRRKGSGVTGTSLSGRRMVGGGGVSTDRGSREEGGIESSQAITAGQTKLFKLSYFSILRVKTKIIMLPCAHATTWYNVWTVLLSCSFTQNKRNEPISTATS